MSAEAEKEMLPEDASNASSYGRIKTKVIEDEMKQSYIDYAMSVIVGRALPDVRDGLKPVHRRILYAMYDMGMLHNKPFKKSARIVGEVLGKYHPHGDSAVYDALVRMAQDFSLRYPLIQGQGNFGSVDGDAAAAMRYTEARLNRIAEEMLQDIEKETVRFVDNFDGSLKEPAVLPSKVPNLIVNGSSGIAVGMATNIPPHNLGEVAEGIIRVIDNPEIELQELMKTIKGPDFPTGGIICGMKGVAQAYATGQGHIKVRAKTSIERKGEKESIIVEEIPYMVNKAQLIEQIAHLVKEKKITGISDLRDESDREGMRIVIELKKGENSEVILNQLFKHTRLQETIGINMLALVNGEPKLLSLKQLISEFIEHRKDIVKKRTRFDLKNAEKRVHILKGIIIALNNLDNVIGVIRKAKSTDEAKQQLVTGFSLSNEQASAVLDMKLQRLTSLEQEKIHEEHKKLKALIQELRAILASEEKILGIIKEELKELKEKYGDERRTVVEEAEQEDFEIEDLIKEEDVVITLSHAGYVKRTPLNVYKKQRRGGTGVIAAVTKEEDFVEKLFVANTHNYLLVFTNTGQVYWLKVFKIPEGARHSKGKAIVNLVDMQSDERVAAVLPLKDFEEGKFLILATKSGIVKKTPLIAYSRPRRGGIKAISLEPGDEVINAKITDGTKQLILATRNGLAIKFHEKNVRPMGRSAKGVIGIRLKGDDRVVGMVVADDTKTLLTLTENGFGKRSLMKEYRLIGRGGYGVINIKCSDRNGHVVSVKSVDDEDEIMLISKKGNIIRTSAHGISVIGRNTQGVRVMKLKPGDTAVAAAKIVRESGDEIREDNGG